MSRKKTDPYPGRKLDPEQRKTPFLTALIRYIRSNPTCFDVPGHKMGSFVTDLSRKISPVLLHYDVNAPIGLDNLYNTNGCIKEAEELGAKLCHADHCLFSVNGTTGGILTMFTACLDLKDKVILPRNVHKSVINSLIVSGAVPIFVTPDIDEKLGVANGVSAEKMIEAMDENPTAKAVFVINPTYFGVCSDLKRIVEEAHKRNMIVMTDEAHGSNFYFSDELPMSAMDAGADITAMSMHKNSGSLTQTSFILSQGDRVNFREIRRAFAMFSSTSPDHLLLASLDAARKEMAVRGESVIHHDLALAAYARKEINRIPGLHVYGREYIDEQHSSGVFNIDETKLVIQVTGLGLNMYGYEAYREIQKVSNVQVELGEVSVILALVGPGTTKKDVDTLIAALWKLSRNHYSKTHRKKIPSYNYSFSKMVVAPRDGYDAPNLIIPLKDSIGEISGETVMAYPPGIPLVIPGEVISLDAVRMIQFFQKEGGEVLKDTEPTMIKVIDRKKWYLSDELSLRNL
jgi:arginine decarboxylase